MTFFIIIARDIETFEMLILLLLLLSLSHLLSCVTLTCLKHMHNLSLSCLKWLPSIFSAKPNLFTLYHGLKDSDRLAPSQLFSHVSLNIPTTVYEHYELCFRSSHAFILWVSASSVWNTLLPSITNRFLLSLQGSTPQFHLYWEDSPYVYNFPLE